MADQPVIERFRAWLREQNLPATPQRLAIADVLFHSGRHLSAEEVAAALAARGISVGTATVYRTLDVLVASGLVTERNLGEGFRRFEASPGLPHVEHLLCTACGRVKEFRDEAIDQITKLVAETHDFERERHRLVIYGVCRDCRAARDAAAPRERMRA